MYTLYIIIIAVSLSIDTFSVSLNIGNHIKNYFIFSSIVGLLHFSLIFVGFFLGSYLNSIINNTNLISSLVFFYIAVNTIKNKNDVNNIRVINYLEIILVALGVSIDSLGIGITLSKNILLSSFIISLFSFSFTYIGLILSKYIKKNKLNFIGFLILSLIGILHFQKFIYNFV